MKEIRRNMIEKSILLMCAFLFCASGCGRKSIETEMQTKAKTEITETEYETEYPKAFDEPGQYRKEESRRIPGVREHGSDWRPYDHEDTVYYKHFYDDFAVGKIMTIDYSPHVEDREKLEDYFTEETDIRQLDHLVSMFYDDRTIETDENELEFLFWEHGYLIDFHRVEYGNMCLRVVEITEKNGLSLYPVRILMQTWDDDFIYLQDVTSPVPRKIRDMMVVDQDGIWDLIVHSSGISREYVAEEELSFWEFTGADWVLVPMELEMDTSHAHIMGELYPDLDRDELFEIFNYRDGMAFRPSLQNCGTKGDRVVLRLGSMEVIRENKSFRLNAVLDVEGRTVEWGGKCYIQFDVIAEKEMKEVSYSYEEVFGEE